MKELQNNTASSILTTLKKNLLKFIRITPHMDPNKCIILRRTLEDH